jgi:hypothetical protein
MITVNLPSMLDCSLEMDCRSLDSGEGFQVGGQRGRRVSRDGTVKEYGAERQSVRVSATCHLLLGDDPLCHVQSLEGIQEVSRWLWTTAVGERSHFKIGLVGPTSE